jgi:hypothetical protein
LLLQCYEPYNSAFLSRERLFATLSDEKIIHAEKHRIPSRDQ